MLNSEPTIWACLERPVTDSYQTVGLYHCPPDDWLIEGVIAKMFPDWELIHWGKDNPDTPECNCGENNDD